MRESVGVAVAVRVTLGVTVTVLVPVGVGVTVGVTVGVGSNDSVVLVTVPDKLHPMYNCPLMPEFTGDTIDKELTHGVMLKKTDCDANETALWGPDTTSPTPITPPAEFR